MYPWYVVFGQNEGIFVNAWVYAKLGVNDAHLWMSPRGGSRWVGGYKDPKSMDVVWYVPGQPRPPTPTSYDPDWERDHDMYD